jgi:hypothetical protein
LWSCTEIIGTTREPSEKTRKDTSSPRRNSSITMRAPAVPYFFSVMMEATASFASVSFSATTVPFPAASPSAFTTTG